MPAGLQRAVTCQCTLQDIKSKGFRVDTALLNALISALGSEGLAHEALAVFRTMVCAAVSSHLQHPTCSHSNTC